jgi:hypothetical protein
MDAFLPAVLPENSYAFAKRHNAYPYAYLLFGDEVSFAQWGSLSYTWARKAQQPTIETSGKRK